MSNKKRNIFIPLFTHSKNERMGIIVLIIIVLILFITPSFLPYCNKNRNDAQGWSEFTSKINEFEAELALAKNENALTLFSFDPNTCDSLAFNKLGFSLAQTASILHYRNKGGIFKSSNDFAKLYVVSDSVFNKLKPYINIEETSRIKQSHQILELNSADTTMLKALNGIGEYYAKKIVERRNKLGGFVSLPQLLEIYGIDDVRLDGFKHQIKIDTSLIQKININTAKASILRSHPYLNHQIVYGLTRLRTNIGRIDSMNQLIENEILTRQQAEKLEPYIRF